MAHPQDNIITVSTLAVLICLSAFTIDITLPVLPDIANAFNTEPRLGSMTVSFYLLGYALGQIPFGICADRFGRLPALNSGLAMFVITGLLNIYASDINQLFLFRCLQGLAGAVAAVLSRAIVRDISSGSRTVELMSIMTIALGVSTLTAPVTGSYLATIFGWRSTLYFTTILSFILLISFMFFLKETKPDHESGDTLRQQLVDSFRAFISEKQSLWAMCILAISFGGYASILVSAAPILRNVYFMSTQSTGLILGLSLLPYFLGALYSHRQSGRLGTIRLLRTGVGFFGISGLLLTSVFFVNQLPLIIFWPMLLFFFLGFGILMPCANAVVLEPLPNSAGFASSIAGTVQIGTGAVISAITSMMFSGSIKGLAFILVTASLLILLVFSLKNKITHQVSL